MDSRPAEIKNIHYVHYEHITVHRDVHEQKGGKAANSSKEVLTACGRPEHGAGLVIHLR